MYVPKRFEESRTEVLHEAIRAAGVGIVVSTGDDGLIATHVPIELDPGPPHGWLRCHFTKPNPHVRALADGAEVLVIFNGPQTYITPNWYTTKAENGRVVPTWNYAAVHVYGRGAAYDDADKLRRHLAALSAQFEASEPSPWSIDDAPADFIDQQMRGIVGMEIQIERIEGKWKMSQNRAAADREAVVRGLRARGRAQDEAVADAVEEAHRAMSEE